MQKARRHPIRAPTACKRMVSGSLSPFYSKCFSPFLHSTCSLSVFEEYLALEDGPPIFKQDFACPALLVITIICLSSTGFRSEEHTSELQSRGHFVCRLLL